MGALVDMPCSPLGRARRAFVSVLLSVAAAYGVAVSVNRDSPDDQLLKTFRRVALKAHPDKGGSKKEFQKLQAAREAWDSARKKGTPPGRPSLALARLESKQKPEKRVRGVAVLLT